MRVFFHALLLLAGLLITHVSAIAQYTPVSYNFPSQPAQRPYSTYEEEFATMASNGYGQWTTRMYLHPENNNQVEWLLFGDTLTLESLANLNKPVPSGVIASGSFNTESASEPIHGQIKVAANLQGSVRYVWRDPEQNGWRVQGFSDGQSSPINLDPKFSGIPNKQTSIATAGIQDYGVFMAGQVFFAQEADWRDQFDVAMDAKYLYVIDCALTLLVVDLATNQQVVVPMNGYSPVRRPTISCDVRNAPEKPTCWIAGLQNPGGGPNDFITCTINRLLNGGFLNNTPFFPRSLPKLVTICDGTTRPFRFYRHVRVLTGSVPGPEVIDRTAIYAIAESQYETPQGQIIYSPYVNDVLYMDNLQDPTWSYVDGWRMTNYPPPYLQGTDHYVVDGYIGAVANPYDGQKTASYDEFHCLYRLRDKATGSGPQLSGVMIVKKNYNGCFGTTDSRTPLNRQFVSGNWQWCVGGAQEEGNNFRLLSANQLGIHALWHSMTFAEVRYSRDKRRIDEDVEENTIISNDCIIGNGTAHGGVEDPTVLPGKTLTIWTDMQYGVGNYGGWKNGIYVNNNTQGQSWQNGRLRIVDADVTLNIGATSGAGATLVLLPNYQFSFDNTGQTLRVQHGSFLHNYGLPGVTSFSDHSIGATNVLGAGTIHLKGDGAVFPLGSGPHDPPTSLLFPATVYLHGGANFVIPDKVELLCENSVIRSLREPSIMPAHSQVAGLNPIAIGQMTVHGVATIENSHLYSTSVSAALGTEDKFLLFKPCLKSANCNQSGDEVKIINCFVDNTDAGPSVIRFEGSTSTTRGFMPSEVDGGWYFGTMVSVTNPVNDFIAHDMYFDSITHRGLKAVANGTIASTGVYGDVTFKDNYFKRPQRDVTNNDRYCIPIYVNGFAVRDVMHRVRIEENVFPWNSAIPSGGYWPEARIKVDAACAAVLRNYIVGSGYHNGIVIQGGTITSNSLLCDNLIQASDGTFGNMDGIGILTSGWDGYGKMNSVYRSQIGHEAGVDDNGAVVFSRYSSNYDVGLNLTDPFTRMDLSGVHSGGNNYAAFDTIDLNDGALSGGAQIQIDGSILKLGTTSTSASTWGQNSIVGYGNGYLIKNIGSPVVLDLNQNFWGRNPWGSLVTINLTGTSSTWMNGSTTYNNDPLCAANPIACPFSVVCGGGFDPAPFSNTTEGENLTPLEELSCADWFQLGDDLNKEFRFKEAYDTMRAYVYSCNSPWKLPAFTLLNAAVQGMSNDNERWLEYRDWLKSVLYLNTTDPEYYCAVGRSFLHTFQYMRPGLGRDYNGEIAVIDYLLESGRCPRDSTYLRNTRESSRYIQILMYNDTVQDPVATPIDTGKVSLYDIGMEILLGPSNVEPNTKGVMDLYVTFAPNPFQSMGRVHVATSSGISAKVELYDVLGNRILDLGSRWFGEGEHSIPIDEQSVVPGSYYLRLSTSMGDIKTVKIVKN